MRSYSMIYTAGDKDCVFINIFGHLYYIIYLYIHTYIVNI